MVTGTWRMFAASVEYDEYLIATSLVLALQMYRAAMHVQEPCIEDTKPGKSGNMWSVGPAVRMDLAACGHTYCSG